VGGRLDFNVNRTWIIPKAPPSFEGFVRRNGRAIHRDPIGQQTQDRKTRQEAGPDSSVRLLLPPTLSHFVRDMALNQQREEDVSVRDTRH
jgi:hypothetical protein